MNSTLEASFPWLTWKDIVSQRLEELTLLNEGWDGYEGVPVSRKVAQFTYDLLGSLCLERSNLTAPQIVPGSSGEIQLEWHTDKGDLVLFIPKENHVKAELLLRFSSSLSEEMELRTDFSPLIKWIRQI